jgi:hypothetical protein
MKFLNLVGLQDQIYGKDEKQTSCLRMLLFMDKGLDLKLALGVIEDNRMWFWFWETFSMTLLSDLQQHVSHKCNADICTFRINVTLFILHPLGPRHFLHAYEF